MSERDRILAEIKKLEIAIKEAIEANDDEEVALLNKEIEFYKFKVEGFSPEEQRAQQDLSAVRDQEDAKLAVQQQELDKEAQNIVIATIQVPMHVPKKETNGINVQQHQDQRESIAPSEITTDKSNGVLSKSGKDLNAKLPQMFVTSTDNVQMDLPCTVDEKDLDRLVSESYPDDDMNSYRPLAGSRMEAARNMRKKLLSRNSSRVPQLMMKIFFPRTAVAITFRVHRAMSVGDTKREIAKKVGLHPDKCYLFLPSKELILLEDRLIGAYEFVPYKNQDTNYLEFRTLERKLFLQTKTNVENLYKTTNFVVPDHTRVSELLTTLVPQIKPDLHIFSEFRQQVFLLDSNLLLPTENIPEIVPFVVLKNNSAQQVSRLSGIRNSSSNISELALSKKPHNFVATTFAQPTWCKVCSKFIFGIVKQGFRCAACKMPCHKKCLEKAPHNCGTATSGPDLSSHKLRNATHGFFVSFVPEDETDTTDSQLSLGLALPTMEGYLSKRQSSSSVVAQKAWKVMYFRLLQDKLFYFKSHESEKPLGYYDVFSVTSIEKNSTINNITMRSTFRITLREETLDLRPVDELLTTKKIWVYVLSQWVALSNFFMKQTELSRTSLFSYLPEQLVVRILTELSDYDLRVMACVCKKFMHLVNHIKRNRLGNWKQGTFNVNSLNGHTDKALCSALIENDTILVSGSSDKTIKLWKNGKCTQTLEGHKEAVTCLSTTAENIVSGSMDTTVKIWSLKTSRVVNSLRAHNGGVTCVGIENGKIFSGSHDQTLRVWDFETGKLLQTIEGHTGAISCLSLQDDVVLTGSWDKSIRIWDLRSQKPEIGVVSNAHKDKILCLQCDIYQGQLVTGGADSVCTIWDSRKDPFARIHSLTHHQGPVTCLEFNGVRLATGSTDSVVRIYENWNGAEKPKQSIVMRRHSAAITSVHLTATAIVSSSEDNSVKICKFF